MDGGGGRFQQQQREEGLWPHLKVSFDLPQGPAGQASSRSPPLPGSPARGAARPSSSPAAAPLRSSVSLPDLAAGAGGRPPSPAAVDAARRLQALVSPSKRRGLPDGSKLVWEQTVMDEMKEFKAMSHPLFKRMHSNVTREALVRSKTSGELDVAQAALRLARSQLGLHDPLVQATTAWVCEVERNARECRELLSVDTLRALPAAMSKIGRVLVRLQKSKHELGPSIWENFWLRRARERHSAWKRHRAALLDFEQRASEGPAALCAAWAAVALGASEARFEFGPVMTKELPNQPGIGPALVRALADPGLAHLVGGDAATDDDPHARLVAKIARISTAIGTLSNRQLDMLLLTAAGAEGESAMQVAAGLADSAVFCALLAVLRSDVLALDEDTQRHLEEADEAFAEFACMQRVAIKLGEHLKIRPSHICVWNVADGGLKFRLFPLSHQPCAGAAQQILGESRATLEPWRRGERCEANFVKLRRPQSGVEEIFRAIEELPHVRARARLARGEADEAAVAAAAAEQQARQAKVRAAEMVTARENADKALLAARTRWREADAEAFKWRMSVEDDIDDKVEAAERAYREAIAAREAAEDGAKAAARAEVRAAEEREAAEAIAAEAEAERRVAEQKAQEAAAAAAGRERRFEDLLLNPLASAALDLDGVPGAAAPGAAAQAEGGAAGADSPSDDALLGVAAAANGGAPAQAASLQASGDLHRGV